VAGLLFVCPMGELEQLYAARSAADYDVLKADLHARFGSSAHPGTSLTEHSAYKGIWHIITNVAPHSYS